MTSVKVRNPARVDEWLREHGSAVQLFVLAAFFAACVAAGLALWPGGAPLFILAVAVPGIALFRWVWLLGDPGGDNED